MGHLQADTNRTKRFRYELQAVKLIFEGREYNDGKFEWHNEKSEQLIIIIMSIIE